MVTPSYTSGSVAKVRDRVNQSLFTTLCDISDLSYRGLGFQTRISILRNLDISEEDFFRLSLLTRRESIKGLSLNSDQTRLGIDSDGVYRHYEYLGAIFLEKFLGKLLYRAEDKAFDYYDFQGYSYDLVGPVPNEKFSIDDFICSCYSHLGKQSLDYAVFCIGNLPEDIQRYLKIEIDTLCYPENLETKKIVLDTEVLNNINII